VLHLGELRAADQRPLSWQSTGAWFRYQLQKQLGLFPAQGRVIPWEDEMRVLLLSSSQGSQSCLYYGLHDYPSMQFLRRYLRLGDLCADIGANVGIYSLLMARHAGATQVHAFEMLASNISKLRANLRLNGFDGADGVLVHDHALADRDGQVLLNAGDGDSTGSISPPPATDGEAADGRWVQARRLDSFPWPAGFAFIKIDVEGAEQLVLQGGKQLLPAAPMVWSFEYLDTQQRLGFSKAALLEAFASWEYQFFLYRPTGNRLVAFIPDSHRSWPRREDQNVLAIHTSAIDLVARRLSGVA
jgi:FkbM family methyltransferase